MDQQKRIEALESRVAALEEALARIDAAIESLWGAMPASSREVAGRVTQLIEALQVARIKVPPTA